jgi:hypothetical protein
MNILAFSGRKQSGKSTSAEYVESLYKNYFPELNCKIYNFAYPLKKDICMNILGMTYDQCYGSDMDKNTLTDLSWGGEQLTARRAMEVIGTDIFRQLFNDVWVRATVLKIQQEKPSLAIIPDCRFPNEVETLLQYNANVVRLTLDPFHSLSNSESALDPDKYNWNRFSLVIDNTDQNITTKNQQILAFLQHKGLLP